MNKQTSKPDRQEQPTVNRQQQAVMYLRVGSATPGRMGQAIAQQREACQRIADRHGLKVIREYADIGRPAQLKWQIELQRLLDDLDELRDAAFVLGWDHARFGRSREQSMTVTIRIQACGAAILTFAGVEVVHHEDWGWLRLLQSDEKEN